MMSCITRPWGDESTPSCAKIMRGLSTHNFEWKFC
jgi:hypothetical protein